MIADEANSLSAFLSHSDRPEGTLSLHELQGFLFAIACAPEMIMPSDWLPLISNDEDMGFRDPDEAETILGLIMTLYNEINLSVIERSDAMPAGCEFLADTSDNLEEEAPVSQWSRGFAIGHDWLQELWDAYVPEDDSDTSEELGACLMSLMFFASRKMAELLYFEGTGKRSIKQEPFAAFAETMRRLFPAALASYADIGRTISETTVDDRNH